MAERFVAEVSRRKLLGLTVLGFGMTAVCLYVALDSNFSRAPIAVVAGWTGAVFFPLCIVAIVRQFFRTGPVLEIGPEGVRWRRWSDQMIPWMAVTRAETTEIQRQKFLSLWLRTPQAYRSTGLLGRLASANRAMGFGDIALSVQGTNRSHAELVAAVSTFAPHLLQR